MKFFQKYYPDVDFDKGEVKVLCPFHNDTNPSASINTEKEVFKCWVCGTACNEYQFMAKVTGISEFDAVQMLGLVKKSGNIDWKLTSCADLWADDDFLGKVRELGFSDKVIDELQLGLTPIGRKEFLGIPVFFNNALIDIRRYNINKYPNTPKLQCNEGSLAGAIIPYDVLKSNLEKSDATLYLFEGEKDMILARSLGLEAFCLTGGASSTVHDAFMPILKDRKIIICYDNDDAGREGAYNLWKQLKDHVKSFQYIDLSTEVQNEHEDFHDYIMKYNHTVDEFLQLPIKDFTEINHGKSYIRLTDALRENIHKKPITSIVTITSDFSDTYSVPSVVHAVKGEVKSEKDDMYEGEERDWFLKNDNIYQMLPLIETDAKTSVVNARLLALLGIPSKEPNVVLTKRMPRTVYMSSIADKDIEGSAITIDLYSFEKLQVGSQYEIEYAIYPHPTKNQKLVAIALNVKDINTDESFAIQKELLAPFQSSGPIGARLQKLYESAKHYVAKHMDYHLWLMTDMVFNSVLDFEYGEMMRGCLDIFILGDTQVGKSETTSKLVDLYKFGHFLSLKTSTEVGLIGGSNSVNGSWRNTIGAIPRQHGRLVIMEEFSGAPEGFIKRLTDIRSSNILRLTRGAGELIVKCKLRMITISNPINDASGNPRFLNSFPNGVIPLMELIKSAEDVTRYDGFLLIPKREKRINPFQYRLVGEPIPRECYEYKSKWVTTRRPENVKFEEDVEAYIWEKGEELNAMFECNFPVFGTTTAKKLARFCVAMAALLVNTDESYENIIVTKEIVDYVCQYLIEIYTAPWFKLDKYKQEWDSYNNYTEQDLREVQKLYPNNAVMFDFLAGCSKTSRSNLSSISGLERDKFNVIFNNLVTMKLIQLNMDTVYPTEKYRKLYQQLDKRSRASDTLINSVGQGDYDLGG